MFVYIIKDLFSCVQKISFSDTIKYRNCAKNCRLSLSPSQPVFLSAHSVRTVTSSNYGRRRGLHCDAYMAIFLIQLLNIAGLGSIWGAVGGAIWGPSVFLRENIRNLVLPCYLLWRQTEGLPLYPWKKSVCTFRCFSGAHRYSRRQTRKNITTGLSKIRGRCAQNKKRRFKNAFLFINHSANFFRNSCNTRFSIRET